MPAFEIAMKPPRWVDRRWYARLGRPAPVVTGSTGHPRSAPWVRLLVPYRARGVHHWYATYHRYYWLPCPSCGTEYGGHESGGVIPAAGPGSGRVICSRCTRSRPATEPTG